MTKLHIALHKVNAWQIRIVALAFLVLCIGSGSQFLVNAFAAGAEPEVQAAQTTVILKPPTVVSTPVVHIKIRRAGVDSFGGYTIRPSR